MRGLGRSVALGAGLLAAAVGCGGPPDLAPEATVSRWIDEDDCAVLSQGLLERIYGDRETCDRLPGVGLREGDYTLGAVADAADEAVVAVVPRTAAPREYTLIREDGRWRVDDVAEVEPAPVGALGTPRLVTVGQVAEERARVRLVLTPLSAGVSDPPVERWPFEVRVRVESQSPGGAVFAPTGFTLDTGESAPRHMSTWSTETGEGWMVGPGQAVVYVLRFDVPDGETPRTLAFAETDRRPIRWSLTAAP